MEAPVPTAAKLGDGKRTVMGTTMGPATQRGVISIGFVYTTVDGSANYPDG